MTLQGDALGNPFVHDPILKAGQEPAGGIASGIRPRATKGPQIDYLGSLSAMVTLGASASGVAIYGDIIDVTDTEYVFLGVQFRFNEDAGAFTVNANLAIGLESSGDGINWFPVSVIDRVNLIDPATMFRDDAGQTTQQIADGGFADATTTQNAVFLEDMVAILPANATATTDPFVVSRAYRVLVPYEPYVRFVFSPIYDEPPDTAPPSIAAIYTKAAS